MIRLQIIAPIKGIKNPDLAKQPVETKGNKKKKKKKKDTAFQKLLEDILKE